ncbi:MAG TPA: sulfurtransferase [Nocardia sp.]|uniref:sulfurtransferase n=1 Tax=Nocardia TaxID=1817 RepID=UPI002458E20A|nr:MULTISPECIES: sulfurtransferase [Nocardia]HLS77518.1 sulfurtransferase [Nocardia sp.]
MPVAPDPHAPFGAYAHPGRLVSTEWLSANIGAPGLVIVESNEDAQLYDIGHVPGAIKIDGRRELEDGSMRDYIDGAAFTELMRAKGIAREDTVVVYGDRGNAQAARTLWLFTLFGHEDVRLLDGGREAWISESRDTTFEPPFPRRAEPYPPVRRDDGIARAFRDDVLARLGSATVLDVRSAREYAGEANQEPAGPAVAALRGGHIPTAVNIDWSRAFAPDGRFRPRAELDAIYGELADNEELLVYSGIGERSSLSWFVLTHLLGRSGVRNYDGSWAEWGNSVRLPVVRGEEPGEAPARAGRRARAR